jgi:hypothetical protein
MECTICEHKFNSLSSFYRHNWSDKHLLNVQIKEYEKEIKMLLEIISQYRSISETKAIPDLNREHT